MIKDNVFFLYGKTKLEIFLRNSPKHENLDKSQTFSSSKFEESIDRVRSYSYDVTTPESPPSYRSPSSTVTDQEDRRQVENQSQGHAFDGGRSKNRVSSLSNPINLINISKF